MAVILSVPISAAGRRVLAFFKSVFVLVVDALRRVFRGALHLFPFYSLRPPSSPSPPTNERPPEQQTDQLGSAATNSPPIQKTTAEVRVDAIVSSAGEHTSDTERDAYTMPGPSTSSAASAASTVKPPQKAPVPKVIPALPLVPLLPKKENMAPKPANTAPPAAAPPASTPSPAPAPDGNLSIGQMTSRLAHMRMDGGIDSDPSSPSLPPQRPEENGTAKENVDGPRVDPVSAALLAQMMDSLPREVVRAPAVPMHHGISQTSKLKDTAAIAAGEDSVQIRTHVETPEEAAERLRHGTFMREALDMARLALKTNETPVGCVLVYKDRIIAKGMNATNVSRNGTRHAELMAVCALLSYSPATDTEPSAASSPVKGSAGGMPLDNRTNRTLGNKTNQSQAPQEETSEWGDVDPRDGHLFPYGQKLHPAPRVNKSIITECELYVTVEPCVMCASLLRQLGIKKVYFGAVNDKFGGTGGVFRIHTNSPFTAPQPSQLPSSQDGKGVARLIVEQRSISPNSPAPEPKVLTENDGPAEAPLPGDGGNVERGFEAEGGWGRDEAVTLLRQFYVQENGRAPVPRKKEGRAARLAMMMQRDGHAGGPMIDPTTGEAASGTDTPSEKSPTVETSEMAAAEAAAEAEEVAAPQAVEEPAAITAA